MARQRYAMHGAAGTVRQGSVIQLTKWDLLPVSDVLGEPVEEAILRNSSLMQFLASYRPSTTTVTVWTYPGSFGDFRQLKEELFSLGYATAARPLPQGVLIGGSPSGTKSAAQ